MAKFMLVTSKVRRRGFLLLTDTGINLSNSQIHARILKGPAERDSLSSGGTEGAILLLVFDKAVLLVE